MVNRKLIKLMACLSMAFMVDSAYSQTRQGADIGNGTYGDKAYRETSGDHFNNELLTQVRFQLEDALIDGGSAAQKGDYYMARSYLVEGIQRSIRLLSNWTYDRYPIVKNSLERSIQMNDAFNYFCLSQKRTDDCLQENRRAGRFVSLYMEHIIKYIIPLDEKYYLSFFDHCCNRSWGDSWQNFVLDYKNAALSALELYDGEHGGFLPHSLALDIYETRIAELTFQYVAEDIARDDMGRALKYDYFDARRAAHRLHRWNNGNFGFINSEIAVKYARQEANFIKNSLKNAQCLGSGPYDGFYPSAGGRNPSYGSH